MLLDLPDGRDLEVEVTGPDDGPVFFWHHGTPGCSHQPARVQRATAERGLRYVSYSRAGYRSSTRKPGRSVADVAADVEAVLDHLGVERCLVGGGSGGGPHALATAALLPERTAAVLSVAGVAPYDSGDLDFLAGMGEQNIDEFGAALDSEAAIRRYLEAELPQLREADAPALIASMRTLLPPPDVAVLTDEVGEDAAAGLRGAVSTGVDGWVDDDLAFTRPWGFDLASLSVPAFVWQGSADLMVPISHGRWLADHVPGATVHLLDGQGHLSIGVGHLPEMLDELLTTL